MEVVKTSTGLLAMALVGAGAHAGNLVNNGDFSAGNTGFTSGYTLTTMTPYLFQNGVHGIYAIEPAGSVAGSSAYGDWNNVTTDPTGGNGNVYVADAATTANTIVWTQTVAVTPNTNYTFTFYGAEISNACCSNAQLQPTINGTNGSALNVNGTWQQSGAFVWNSGSNTSATLSITDLNTSGAYNDFVLDDIALTTPVPTPASWGSLLLGLGLFATVLRRRPLAA